MSKLTRLQAELVKVQARIADIEAAYPTLAQYKGYSRGFGEVSTTYQDFGSVGAEYRRLLDLQRYIEDQIGELNDAENTGSSVGAFREVST